MFKMKSTGYNSVNSWIATFACAVIGFLGLVPVRLSGLFFVIILDQFQTSRKLAILPIIIYGTIRTLGGPFTGYLGEVFGLRTIMCIGSALMAIGVGCCYFAKDLIAIIFFLGVIYGTGLAFTNSLVHSVVRQHFNRNLNLVNGLYLTGSCMGATILSPIIQYLINNYGISGMYLILSAILLNAVPASIILKNPKNEIWDLNVSLKNAFQNDGNEKVELSDRRKYAKETSKCANKENNLCIEATQNLKNLKKSENAQSFIDCTKKDPELYNYSVKDVLDIREKRRHSEQSHLNKKGMYSNRSTVAEKKNTCWNSFQLFLDRTFLLQMFVQSIDGFIIMLNWTIIVDFGRDKGIETEWGLYFVMFLPVSEMCGNLSLNWITDRGFLSRTHFCIICFIAKAVVSGLIMWANSFAVMMVGIMTFGYLTGALTSTYPGLIIEFIDKDKQNMALASRYTLFGVFSLLKSLIIGFFRENLGSYNGIYYLIIACCMLCIFFSFLTPISALYEKKKRKGVNKV